MTDLRLLASRSDQHLAEAAAIWAEATAARDGRPEPASLDLARPALEKILDSSPRSLLLVAVDPDDRGTGFAAVEPMPDGSTADLRYLGVRPGSWGGGVGRRLMEALPARLTAAGFTHGELNVYLDNPRAVTLYEGLGWHPCGEPVPYPGSGRLERRYRVAFNPAR